MSSWPTGDRMISSWSARLWAARAAATVAAEVRAASIEQFLIGDPAEPAPVARTTGDRLPVRREERGALVGILTRLLRGNDWGRTGAAVVVAAVAAEATREATALLDRHLSEVEPALDRLAAIATTDPDAPLWGVEPPTPVRAPAGTA